MKWNKSLLNIPEEAGERVVQRESIVPTARQMKAFMAPERYILYGGAMGGGKTTWLCQYAIELSLRYPGNMGYLCRHELRSFKRTTLVRLEELLPWELVIQHHKTDNFIRFHNESTIYYGGLGDDQRQIDRLKSLELGWFGIDQAEETTEKFFFMLGTRLRLKTEKGLRYKGLLTANPDPGWLKARFIDQQLPDHAFIPALPRDNPHLPKDYEDKIRDMDIPEELKRAWLEGDWDAITSTQAVYQAIEVMKAMEREVEVSDDDDEVFGLDVAEYGGDETVLTKRKGLKFDIVGAWRMQDPMESVGKVVRALGFNRKTQINVDAIGTGSGVYYRLKELGYNARPIKGSASPSRENQERFKNYRAELHWNLRAMLPYVSLPKDPDLRAQLCSIKYRVLSSGIIIIESKEEMRRRGLPSPDRADAIIYAAAPPEQRDDESLVWYAGLEGSRAKSKEKKAPKKKMPWERKKEPQRSANMKRKDWEDDDEGKVYIQGL